MTRGWQGISERERERERERKGTLSRLTGALVLVCAPPYWLRSRNWVIDLLWCANCYSQQERWRVYRQERYTWKRPNSRRTRNRGAIHIIKGGARERRGEMRVVWRGKWGCRRNREAERKATKGEKNKKIKKQQPKEPANSKWRNSPCDLER
jgi:hypothetical protein